MTGVKLGFDQANNPAPLGYRRWRNIIICVLAPTVSFLHSLPGISDVALHVIDQAALYIGSLMTALGVALGNGQKYNPSNETMDKRAEEKREINSPK